MSGRFTSRLRHYIGLRSTETKLERLLKDFEYQLMGTMIDGFRGGLASLSLEHLAQSRS
jgi:hypothetical protein